MPTVPVRNTLHERAGATSRSAAGTTGAACSTLPAGRRSRGWAPSLPAALRRAGYWTAYVTDNPFLGFSVPYRPLRRSVHRFVRTRRPDRRPPRGRVRARAAPLAPPRARARRQGAQPRCASTSPTATTRTTRRAPSPLACSRTPCGSLDRAATQRPVRDGGGHLRAARAVDPAAQVHRPLRRPRLPRPASRASRATGGSTDYFHGDDRSRMLDAHARPLRGRGHDDRPLAGRVPRPPPRRCASTARPRSCWWRDHGFLLGEYGFTGKISSELHPPLMRVPLVVVDPDRRRAGARERLPGPDATTWRRRCCRWRASARRGAMTGVDLSPLFEGSRPRDAAHGLRRLRERHVRAHRALEVHLGQPRAQPPAVRPRSTTRTRPTTWPAGIRGRAAAMYDAVVRRAGGGRRTTRTRAGPSGCRGSRLRGPHAPEVARDLRGEARPARGAARAGHPHQSAGGGEAALQGQAHRPRADREAARPRARSRSSTPSSATAPPSSTCSRTGPGATPWSPATA